MGAYSVTRTKSATLVAATVDTVTFAAAGSKFEIINQATSAIGTVADTLYIRFAPIDPTVGGAETIMVRPGEAVVRSLDFQTTSIRLIATNAVPYYVERLG